MNKPINPCSAKCELRTYSCHTSCKAYIAFIKEQELWRNNVNKQRSELNGFSAARESFFKKYNNFKKR